MEKNKRFSDSLASKFLTDKNAEALIMKSPSDVGVRRNKGRNGSRFAPEAIENTIKKMNNHLPYQAIASFKVSSQEEELSAYEEAIRASSQRIQELISSPRKRIIHLGGGHDHALPLLRAMDNGAAENILIVNFDAHCDTRIDDISHSGTPFRDFDKEAKKPFHLMQIGIHDFANSPETLSPLERNSESIIYTKDLPSIARGQAFKDAVLASCPFPVNEKTDLFISVDCDAISSSVMSAVSAVNHDGIDPGQLLAWVQELKELACRQKVLGLYEYNPVFEDLSQKGARYLAGLIYRFLG